MLNKTFARQSLRRGGKILSGVLVAALASLGTNASHADPIIVSPNPGVVCGFDSTIVSNFNGTPIAAGNSLWFNSVFKLQNAPNNGTPVNVYLNNASVTFQDKSGNTYTVHVPNAKVTFDPVATTASTSFDSYSNTWVTVVPFGLGGNTFLDGAALPLASNLPGGINPVSWSGQVTSDTAGITVAWQWATAAYTNFSANYSLLDVKPVDSNQASVYANSDHAGTPEAYKPFVIGGARGGGGSNWTGSYSGTMSQSCQAGTATTGGGRPPA
ncbi:hypothetical protein [Dyella flagellata]|uniref:Uncharacterized protein n=1 Tax=Dyella flagellata TaxID=1867833 RepID=A0ABQ5XIT5_9GAMM|nr:hypothetical protein [Dyella flagellata]GLQ90448.1 hypothetical protein GCM10007898_40240 [Dyella flagellata]